MWPSGGKEELSVRKGNQTVTSNPKVLHNEIVGDPAEPAVTAAHGPLKK